MLLPCRGVTLHRRAQQTLKFDNLCQNFREHGDLDTSGAIVKITKDPAGAITSMSLDSASGVPVPVTVPTASAAAVRVVFGRDKEE